MEQKKYPAYKDSGIEWIGEILEHWEVKKLKYEFDFLNHKRVPLSSEERGKMKNKVFDYYGASGVIDKVEDYIFDEPLILIGEDGANLLSRSTRLAFIAEGKYWVNNHAHIVKPKFGSLEYMVELLELIDYSIYVTGSAQPKLTLENLTNILIPCPPQEEQTSIAQYLDKKTALIGQTIAKKEKLIALLEEERKALINEAVTKGIDPNAPLKPSGIDWLGDIPAHWEVKKLKYVSMIQFSNVDKKVFKDEEKVLLCNYMDVYKNEVIDDKIQFMAASANKNEISKFKLKLGDVLVTKDSETPDDIAVPALVMIEKYNLLCGYHLAQIRPNSKVLLGAYLFRLFQSRNFNSHFEISATGVTRFGLGTNVFKEVYIPLPPISEQSSIVEYLLHETERIKKTIITIQKEIELLKEFRQALIFEAVTGKIDVRDAVAEHVP